MRTNVPGGLRVVGRTDAGLRVDAGPLAHGEDPVARLANQGWATRAPISATVVDDGALELTYAVTEPSGIRQDRLDGGPDSTPAGGDVTRDPGVAADATAEPYQRVAAYAIVTSERGLLLTQFSGQTNREDDWGLPGGGLDEGEGPVDGVHREVWEETGQRIVLGELAQIQSQHWIGRAPGGGLEDFHAVRIVYRATCPEPTDTVIHDVGGTTSDARWVPVAALGDYRLTPSWRRLADLLDSSTDARH